MSIEYNPGVTFRGGELIGAGLERGADALGDAIKTHADNLKKLKGAKLLAEGYGLDTSTLGSVEEVQGALGAQIARQQQAARLREQQGTEAIPGFISAINQNQQPQPAIRTPDSMYLDLAGGGVPGTSMGARPGMDPRSAFAAALQKFSPVLNDPKVRESILGAAIKNGLVQPKMPQFTTDPSGKPIAIDPSGRVQWAPGNGSKKSAPETTLLVDPATGKKYGASFSEASGKYELFPHEANPKPTRDPGDGPLKSKDGKFFWDDKDQTWKPHNAKADMFGGGAGAGAAPATAGNPKDPLGLGL